MLICLPHLKTASAFDTEEMRIGDINHLICLYEDLVCDRKQLEKTSEQPEKQQNTQAWSQNVLFFSKDLKIQEEIQDTTSMISTTSILNS